MYEKFSGLPNAWPIYPQKRQRGLSPAFLAPEPPEHACVQCQGTGEGGGGTVGQSELFCCLFYNRRQGAEVYVANVGEQVVFNLVIEPAAQPSKYPRPGAEVGCGLELV